MLQDMGRCVYAKETFPMLEYTMGLWTRQAEIVAKSGDGNDRWEETEQPTSEVQTTKSAELLFVGDSRVVGMASVGGHSYVGAVGMGYQWLTGEGGSLFAQAITDCPNAAAVLCFGINDLGNLDSYVEYYQTLIETYPERDIYIMSVNPVKEDAEAVFGYRVTNEEIEAFNQTLMEAFPDRYIDVYGYLSANGYGTVDGVHYDQATYGLIQEYTLLMINMMQNFGNEAAQ